MAAEKREKLSEENHPSYVAPTDPTPRASEPVPPGERVVDPLDARSAIPAPDTIISTTPARSSTEDRDAARAPKSNSEFQQPLKAPGARTRVADYKELSEEEISRLTSPEIRAIAHDRGYTDVRAVGSRAARRQFLAAQANDESLS
jgi:hypothetical protein